MHEIRLLAEQVLVLHGKYGTPSEILIEIGAIESSFWLKLFRKPHYVRSFVWDEEGDWVQIVSSFENPISSKWIIFERKNRPDRLVLDRRGNAMIFLPTGPEDSLEQPNENNFVPASEEVIENTIGFLKFLIQELAPELDDSY